MNPVFESGIVFYVYNQNKCNSQNKYLNQLLNNIRIIKKNENTVCFTCSYDI